MSKLCPCCRRCPFIVSSKDQDNQTMPGSRRLVEFIPVLGLLADAAQEFDDISEGETFSASDFSWWLQREVLAFRREPGGVHVLRLHDISVLRSKELV